MAGALFFVRLLSKRKGWAAIQRFMSANSPAVYEAGEFMTPGFSEWPHFGKQLCVVFGLDRPQHDIQRF
ncbi:hypothetical protein [Methylomonas koyamae]|uniref:hypothetical protein n=1 Tax=Methylomonas koyamae TaxID=702114 RepID=UPI0018E0B2F7|nr:hypothetical protein [Methylomonas koyamae]